MIKKVVITGASGFIGQQLVPLLKKRGVQMLLIGRKEEKLRSLFPEERIATYNNLKEAVKGYDALVHLATKNNNIAGSLDEFRNVNVDLLKQVIKACQNTSIKSFIYLSSFQTLTSNTSYYGITKKEAEEYLSSINDIQVISLSVPIVFGSQFSGKLKLLNYAPKPLTPFLLNILSLLKPMLNIETLEKEIFQKIENGSSIKALVSNKQNGNYLYNIFRITIDFSFCFVTISLFWWLLVFCWVTIKASSAGPGLFVQERVGINGKIFKCYKFRTMFQGTKQAGTHEISHSSVTPFGSFLRKTKIDELPQILNILRGELSLIGPRPCLPVQSELVQERLKRNVLDIKPGITGLAQVQGIDMSDPTKLAEKDAEYLHRRTLILDLKIAVRTVTGGGSGDNVAT